jgi:hypothetical protein
MRSTYRWFFKVLLFSFDLVFVSASERGRAQEMVLDPRYKGLRVVDEENLMVTRYLN